MQLEQYDEADGRRVRLNNHERERLLQIYEEHDPRRYIGLALMAHCGCRSQEAVDARPTDVVESEEAGRWFLRIPSDKASKERMTPMSDGLANRIQKYTKDMPYDDSILGVTTRTLRRWVRRAAIHRAEVERDERWLHLTPHDLRRTWGHLALEDEVLPSVLMQWGGWGDYEVFQKHYLGKHSERIQGREASKVNWM